MLSSGRSHFSGDVSKTVLELRLQIKAHLLKSACRPRRSFQQVRPCCYNRCRGQETERRRLIAAALLVAAKVSCPSPTSAAPIPPIVGSCVECIGEVNGGLNACTLASPSCVSTQNDDEAHFIPPWQYNGAMGDAVQQLLDAATGKKSTLVASSGARISLKDAADYSFEELQDFLKGKAPPKKPKPRSKTVRACFNGKLEERHTIDDGSEYLHIIFGGEDSADPDCKTLGVIDAEFIFLSGDNVVDIRTASREDPGVRGANLSLSLSYGFQYDTNVAKREMEELRKALRWEQVPVVTDFDPRFNQRRPLFFERLYQPFLKDKQEFEDVVDK